ncbi:MAG TPA: DUF1905 domain-containing protein [Candidatus Limnocylindria bacterium]|nr:DUF1905 domain-containing protein [Candidatus Limnocylindria bacterium]
MLFDEAPSVELEFDGEVVYWRGPSPYHFVTIPHEQCREIASLSSLVTYGWGVIPVTAELGSSRWTTSLFPRQGSYFLPVKDAVRKAEQLELGESVSVRLNIGIGRLEESGA